MSKKLIGVYKGDEVNVNEILDDINEFKEEERDTGSLEEVLRKNESIEDSMRKVSETGSVDDIRNLLDVIKERIEGEGYFIVPVRFSNEEMTEVIPQMIVDESGTGWLPLFTDNNAPRGEGDDSVEMFAIPIEEILEKTLGMEDVGGVCINPFRECSIRLNKDLIRMILD